MDRELQRPDGQGVGMLTIERSGAALLRNFVEQVACWSRCVWRGGPWRTQEFALGKVAGILEVARRGGEGAGEGRHGGCCCCCLEKKRKAPWGRGGRCCCLFFSME